MVARLTVAMLLCAMPASAGEGILAWDYRLDQDPDVRFVLRIVTLDQGRPTQEMRVLDPLPTQDCTQWPDMQRTPHTLCARLCLDDGTYTLTLLAEWGHEHRAGEPVLDVEVTSATPCQPPPQVVARPDPPQNQGGTSPAPAATIATAVVVGTVVAEETKTADLASLVNRACVTWRITGPCFCNPFTPCVSVEYWEPAWLVETVKRPGTTSLTLASGLLSAALAAFPVPTLGGGGAGRASGAGHGALQYHEAHVFPFPQLLGGPCTGCPGVLKPIIHYASEMDPQWRTATSVSSPLDLPTALGVWGRLYPRGGTSIHSSEVVGSGIAAARALDIAAQPIGTPPNVDTHIVLSPTHGTSRCCQLASPKQTPCMPVGTPPLLWETGAISPRGTYVWLFWTKRRCCVLPENATCGLTLPGIGSAGANGCPG